MSFEYLRTPTMLASLLVLAGLLMLIGVFSGRVARGKPVAFVAGGAYLVFGVYLLYTGLFTAPIKLIQIESATYGRPQASVPTLSQLPIATLDCTAYARSICDAHANCTLRFANGVCGRDPDQGSWKIAEVVYRCGNEPPTHVFALESRPTIVVCK